MPAAREHTRDLPVDLARGLACLLMIQTHAFHGWVRADLQTDPAFVVTRVLGAFPLPTFLLLSGVSVALRVRTAGRDRHHAGAVRARLIRRALELVAAGYATSLVWGVLDGASALETFLRADVLHVIGVSLLSVAVLIGPNAVGGVDSHKLMLRSSTLAIVVSVACPWLTQATQDLAGPLRFLIAPLCEVRGVTVMPAVPLLAWCAIGVVLGLSLSRVGGVRDGVIEPRRTKTLAVIGVLAIGLGSIATTWLLGRGIPLSRASIAVWPNLVEGAGRAVLLLALGGALSTWMPMHWQRPLAALGAASLWIYVVHVPFCYGRLAGPLRNALSLTQAAPLVLLLVLASYGTARVWMNARSRGAAVLRSSA